jgi:selenocysteine lyase/cysteine desulfurase
MPPFPFDDATFAAAIETIPRDAQDVASDEAFWNAVRGLYATTGSMSNLENGYWGVMAEPVKDVYHRWTDRINRDNTVFIRRHWGDASEGVRAALAEALGCGIDEIALTRGATEAMLALIGGYNRLSPGDTVLYCDLDYPAMRHAMAWLRERRGVEPVSFSIPEPATREGVLDAYRQMLERHPRTRLVLLTHLSHCTGLVMPVRELSAMASAAGADVIVDAAHSWGQMDFGVASLDAPFVALNLHKWVGAPLGCGALYVRKDRLPCVDRYCGDLDYGEDDVRSRIHTGSPNFAAWLTVPAALALHRRIGVRNKEMRLRHLRNAWVAQARAIPGLDVLTPDDPAMVAGITAFRLLGATTPERNEAIVTALRDKHGVLTVRREGPARGNVVRVTPALYTRHADLDRLVGGLRALGGG